MSKQLTKRNDAVGTLNQFDKKRQVSVENIVNDQPTKGKKPTFSTP